MLLNVTTASMVSYTKYLDLEVFEGKMSKHQYPWHFHDCYTLIVVEDGSIIYEFQDKRFKVDEAEAFLVAPYMIHRNTIAQPTTYKALFLPQEYVEGMGQHKIMTQIVKYPDVVDRIVDLFNKIKLNHSKIELLEIACGIAASIHHPQTANDDDSPSDGNTIPTIDYGLTIKELAQEAHLSKFHFQRKFKKNYGLTIGQLKQQEKTTKAKALLETGKLSTDVAYELGFFDQSHFIKYFRKMWATTPKQFDGNRFSISGEEKKS